MPQRSWAALAALLLLLCAPVEPLSIPIGRWLRPQGGSGGGEDGGSARGLVAAASLLRLRLRLRRAQGSVGIVGAAAADDDDASISASGASSGTGSSSPQSLLSPRSRPLARAVQAAAGVRGADGLATVFDAAALDRLRAAAARDAASASASGRWRKPAANYSAAAAPLDPDRARLFAELQSIAYCGDADAVRTWTCKRCRSIPGGFVTEVAHFDAAWDLSGYAGYLPALDAKVLVFRGTDSGSWANWVENMRAYRVDATYPLPGAPSGLRLHSGFWVMWNGSSMAPTFTEAYRRLAAAHPRGPTYVVGHSMGGALAHLCALDLRVVADPDDLRVVTFGAPRVGNAPFAEFFAAHVAEAWRFTHGRDIVPSLPPTLMGFHHASREVWLVDVDSRGRRRQQRGLAAGAGAGADDGSDGRLEAETGIVTVDAAVDVDVADAGGGAADPDERMVVCDDSGEDPTCHNAACRLGLCTSVADHLVYLGAHMWAGDEC